MKVKLKKGLSLLLAVVFALTMLPIASMVANAEATTLKLNDGTEWLAELGSAASFTSDETGGYTLSASTYKTVDSAYKLMQNKMYPVLTTTFNLASHYGLSSGTSTASFGISIDCSLDNAGTGLCTAGRFEIVRRDVAADTSGLYMLIDGVLTKVGERTATRHSYADRNVVEKNGSYYMTFRGHTIDGTGYSEAVQEAVKLENYFPIDFLENNGMVYFFFTGVGQLGAGSYYKPTAVVANDTNNNLGVILGAEDNYSGDRNNGAASYISSSGLAPKFIKNSNKNYKVQFVTEKQGSAIYSFPVATYANDAYSTFQIGSGAGYTEGETDRPQSPSQDWKLYFEFSNDPYFRDYNYIWLRFLAGKTSNVIETDDPSMVSAVKNLATSGDTGMVNQMCNSSTTYNYTFSVKDGEIYLQAKSGNQYINTSVPFTKLEVGKPIYMRVRKPENIYTNTRFNLITTYDDWTEDSAALSAAVTEAAALENPLDTAETVKAYLESPYRTTLTYAQQVVANALVYNYYSALETTINAAADELIARIDAIPEKLVFADNEMLNALKADYDAASDEVKAKVTNIDKLTNALASVPTEDDGRVRTADGTVWNVDYDSDYVTISSSESGSLLMAADIDNDSDGTPDGKDNKNSYVRAITEDTFPILSGTYHMSLNYGDTDNAAFGLTAYNNMDSIHDVPYNNFTVLRKHNSNNTATFYVMINGERYECGSKGTINTDGSVSGGTVRARVFTMEVVKQNGYHYVSVDGVVLDGTGYSEEVQEAVKLENHFGKDFVDNNGMVHFFTSVDSLTGNTSFARATTRLLDGTIAYAADTIPSSKLNSGYNGSVSSYNTADSKTSYLDGTTTYEFSVAKSGSAILTAPINKDGFTIGGYMAPDASANQNYYFAFSNDPTFKDGTELKLQAAQSKTGSMVYFVPQGAADPTVNRNSIFNNNSYTFSIEDRDANGTYTVYIDGQDSTNTTTDTKLDVTALMDKPIYLKVIGAANGTADMVIVNADSSADKNAEIAAALPTTEQSAEEILEALDTFYASEYRYSSYDNLVKATELYLLANQKTAQAVTDELAAISEDTDYFAQKDSVEALTDTISGLDIAVRGGITNYKGYVKIINYLDGLETISADSLVDMTKLLLDLESTSTKSYDYNNDSKVNILDFIRAKKNLAEETVVYSNSNYKVANLSTSEYNVVGDGVTDDATALANAITALANCGPGSKLTFEANKTYYLKDIETVAAITLNDVDGLTIDGNGSTLLIDDLAEYIRVTNSANCKIENLHLDFKTKPAFTAKCIEINEEERWALMAADRDIGLSDGEIYTPDVSWFGVINTERTRIHMRIEKYEKVSGNLIQNLFYDNLFKIYFTDDATTVAQFDSSLDSFGMICPMPNIAHIGERAATVANNNGFTMENVYFHAASKFGMYIARNGEKDINLTNVSFVPADNELDKDMNFTSWRDAFHCKDNRCAINWTDCTATGNYDDIFNISTTGLSLSAVNETGKEITLKWSQSGAYPEIKAGDTINIINSQTGEDYGNVTVKKLVSTNGLTVVLELKNAINTAIETGTHVYAYVTDLCAPNSTITGCDFSGTYRFRGPLTVTDTDIYNQRMWIDIYSNIEGPVPKNITFKGCTITSGVGATIIIGANSPSADGYHVENIVFEDCALNESTLRIYENDAEYVQLINCTESEIVV